MTDKTLPLAENSVPLSEPTAIEREFQELARVWKVESMFMSSVTDMVNLPSYQKIIGMGPRVIPLLLSDLAREPQHWFIALSALTGTDPVPSEDRGDADKMTAAWFRWGQANSGRRTAGLEGGQWP
jgi:hypothetical protein